VAAGLAVAGPSGGLLAAAARDAGWPLAWIRRGHPYYMICLISFLVLYMIGWFLFERTQGSGLHHPMEWGIDLGVVGALLSVVLFGAARGQFRARQLVWGLVPLLSWTFLAFLPFLWLALIRRRTREWAVFAVYLAAETTMLVISFVVAADAGYELVAGLLLIAPVHAVLAFSPAAGVSSWRETRAATDSGGARLAREQQYTPNRDSGPAIRHVVDRSGTTHTFRYRRVYHVLLGITVVVIGVGILVGDTAALADPSSSWARGDGGVSTWDSIWMAAGGLLMAWLGLRLLRVGVFQISAAKMRVHGYFRTRTVRASEIRAVTLEPKDIGNGHLRWRARVRRTGGKDFWIGGFDWGHAEKLPNPGRAAALDEARALLGVGADDSESALDREVDGFVLAGWVETQVFSTTRLRPGYDINQVDDFLSAIRNTFLGIREPSLTSEEIQVKQFTVTHLRPGYEQLEVDAVLDEAESRLAAQVSARRRIYAAEPESVAADPMAEAVQIRCLECGAENADATRVCARCGAPTVLTDASRQHHPPEGSAVTVTAWSATVTLAGPRLTEQAGDLTQVELVEIG
jgi:DivIVA domain-containing protein